MVSKQPAAMNFLFFGFWFINFAVSVIAGHPLVQF